MKRKGWERREMKEWKSNQLMERSSSNLRRINKDMVKGAEK